MAHRINQSNHFILVTCILFPLPVVPRSSHPATSEANLKALRDKYQSTSIKTVWFDKYVDFLPMILKRINYDFEKMYTVPIKSSFSIEIFDLSLD